MAIRLLFTGGTLSDADKSKIESLGYDLVIERADLTEDELFNVVKDIDVYILGGAEKASRRVLDAASQLKILAFFGVGYQSFVDINAATLNGIAVTNTPGANAISVAEFTISLIVDAVKKVTYLANQVKREKWMEYRTWNLRGKTLGILGMGNIGSRVAKIAFEGFGMKIIYSSRTPKPDKESELSAHKVPLDELFKLSDVISIHAAYDKETIGIVGARELSLMKPTAVLVNAARAELVDPVALASALINGKIAAAAMDGYYIEPTPQIEKDQYSLLKLPDDKLIVTPHTAYLTEDSMTTMLDMCLESIANLLKDKHDKNVVNPDFVRNSRLK